MTLNIYEDRTILISIICHGVSSKCDAVGDTVGNAATSALRVADGETILTDTGAHLAVSIESNCIG